jgi:hypothetical protein
MKRLFLVCSFLLLSAVGARAYSPDDWSAAANWTRNLSTGNAYSETTTIVGTLQSDSTGYQLVDRSGVTYQLTGRVNGLQNHVGDTIKVTGKTGSDSMSESSGMPVTTVDVTSFRRVNG